MEKPGHQKWSGNIIVRQPVVLGLINDISQVCKHVLINIIIINIIIMIIMIMINDNVCQSCLTWQLLPPVHRIIQMLSQIMINYGWPYQWNCSECQVLGAKCRMFSTECWFSLKMVGFTAHYRYTGQHSLWINGVLL